MSQRGLDPGIKTLIDQARAAGGPKLYQVDVAQARQMLYLLLAADGDPEPIDAVEDRTIPGPAGAIRVRTYRGAGSSSGAPVIVWLHGGGWVIGDLETADLTARKLANRTGALVAS